MFPMPLKTKVSSQSCVSVLTAPSGFASKVESFPFGR
jgi:hypothetical protein